MDGPSFDALARTLSTAGSRRRALGGLLAGTLGLLSPRAEDATAKNCKKIKNKAKRKKCLAQAKDITAPQCPGGQRLCRGACLSVLICCDDTDCAGGRTCQQGTCACPADKPLLCSGRTVCSQCCTVDDCRPANLQDGQVCEEGVCLCTIAGTVRCPAGGQHAGDCGRCCNSSECSGAEECYTKGDAPPTCRCRTGTTCDGLCVAPECEALCFAQCPQGVAIGQPCCSGTGALICREEGFPGSGVGSCQP